MRGGSSVRTEVGWCWMEASKGNGREEGEAETKKKKSREVDHW